MKEYKDELFFLAYTDTYMIQIVKPRTHWFTTFQYEVTKEEEKATTELILSLPIDVKLPLCGTNAMRRSTMTRINNDKEENRIGAKKKSKKHKVASIKTTSPKE